MARKIKQGDTVKVIAGRDKGKVGTVMRVVQNGERVVVEKVNSVKRHMRPTQAYPQGGIIDIDAPVHVSNVMLVSPSSGEPFRVGFKEVGTEGRSSFVRYNAKTGETIE